MFNCSEHISCIFYHLQRQILLQSFPFLCICDSTNSYARIRVFTDQYSPRRIRVSENPYSRIFYRVVTNYLACTISKPRSFMKFSHKQYQFFSETVRKRHWQSSHHINSEFIFSSFVYSLIQGLKFVQRLVWYYQHLTVTFQLFKFLAAMEFEDAILLIGLLLYGIET